MTRMFRRSPLPDRPQTRRGTVAGALVILVLGLGVAVLVGAAPAHASVWVIPASARAFPDSQAGGGQTISIDAAGNEYEGVQVALRGGGDHSVAFSWAGGDALITGNTTLAHVAYVRITHPTSHLGAKAGYYPDPLLPRSFGAPTSIPSQTESVYLLTHVPYGTPGGDYAATLHVDNGGESVDVPFRLHVWDFGWRALSTTVALPLNGRDIKYSIAGSGVHYGGANEQRIISAYYTMLKEHGVTSLSPMGLQRPRADGSLDAAQYAASLQPWLGSDGLDLQASRIPWLRWFPWNIDTYTASSGKLLTYLSDVCRVFAQNGWQSKAYAYILDETTKTAEERAAERYARVLHQASGKSGFRCRLLLTDDPRPTSLGGVKTANTFLFDDVDIWVPRYYYFFGRIPALRQQKARGKQVWWYTYANDSVAKVPNFVIEKAPTDERVWGWLMERWDVDGLLNWGLNQWESATPHRLDWRDPYQDPISSRNSQGRVANGDVTLIYPGYYPRYGLNDPFAPPVSSLRFEALRDGMEEREYLRLAEKTPGGQAFADKVMAEITTFPYPIQQKNVFNFPRYTSRVGDFARARRELAARIEAAQTP